MNPRLFLSLFPAIVREKIFYRFLNARQRHFPKLFSSAPLMLAPSYAMRDLVVGDVISGQIAFNGFYELDLSRRIHSLAKKGGVFLDVGANIGYFSLLWASGRPSNKIIAVEASPRNQNSLRATFAANGLCQQMTLLPVAAGNENKQVAFTLGPEDQTGWGGIGSREGWQTIDVEMVRLDSYFPADMTIDVMKIDVEGADPLVIEGCEAMLRDRRIKVIFFELNDFRMKRLEVTPDSAFALLQSCGYQLTRIGADEWMATA